MSGDNDARQWYVQALRDAENMLPARGVAWLRERRAQAAAQFAASGFPTPRDEAWKYTNVASAVKHRYQIAPSHSAGADFADVFPMDLDVSRLVFVNGQYRSDLSSPPESAGRPIAGSLREGLERFPELFEPHLAQVAPAEHTFAALNNAFLLDGAYIFVPAGTVLERPIHVVHLATPEAFSQPRTLIVAQAGSRATVIEQYIGSAPSRYFTNAVTEAVLERGASVEHYRLQQESAQGFHVNGLYLRQREKSDFVSNAVDIGGQLVRNDLQVVLSAENAGCALNGLYVADGRQHIDNHTMIDHAKARCTSREFYKGVLAGRARAVFNGRVLVRPEAQQTDAGQVNNNLLLSDDAEIDTKPELEIYADDVKCSHGATIGQLDPDQLYYLRSRGVDALAARDLLTFAFANEVLQRFRLVPLRLMLERSMTRRLLQGRDIRELELV